MDRIQGAFNGAYNLNMPDIVPAADVARSEDAFVRELRLTAQDIITIANRIIDRAPLAREDVSEIRLFMRDIYRIGSESRHLIREAASMKDAVINDMREAADNLGGN